MPELHHHEPTLSMAVHGEESGDRDIPKLPTADNLREVIDAASLQRFVLPLERIRRARTDGQLTQMQAEDFLARLNDICDRELNENLLERYPDEQKLKKLFGENYLGREAVKTVWGVEIDSTILPPIPFDPKDLKRSAKRGEFLGLTIDRVQDGVPLTMERMGEILTPRWNGTRWITHGELFSKKPWFKNEKFYEKETPPTPLGAHEHGTSSAWFVESKPSRAARSLDCPSSNHNLSKRIATRLRTSCG